MDQNQIEWNEKVAGKIIKKLEKRRMAGSYTPTAAWSTSRLTTRFHPKIRP